MNNFILILAIIFLVGLVVLGALLLAVPMSFGDEFEDSEQYDQFEDKPNRKGAPGHYESKKAQ